MNWCGNAAAVSRNCAYLADPAATSWAGWGFEFNFMRQPPCITSTWSGVSGPGLMSTHNGAANPPAEQTEYTLVSELGEHPVFLRAPSAMFSSNMTVAVRNQILAKGIPALSPAAGKTDSGDGRRGP